jgi:lipid II isoglutaminyl synthase (glutamine-hydrolysing)
VIRVLQRLRFQAVLAFDRGVQTAVRALTRLGLRLPASLMSALLSYGITARLMRSSLGLAALGRRVILVTGTNGKTTTTALVVAALGGTVATNPGNHNFFCGLLDTLLSSTAEIVVLEVDELWLPEVLRWLTPELLLVLNVLEDAWLRTPGPRFVIDRWRPALDASRTTILAWADDPGLVALFGDQPVHWLAQLEAAPPAALAQLCFACGGILRRQGQHWSCSCPIQHPTRTEPFASIWTLSADGARLDPPPRSRLPALAIEPGLNGRINGLNAAFAAAAAVLMGEEPVVVEQRLRRFDHLSLRDHVYQLAGRDVRLLVAKNAAAWQVLMDRLVGYSGLILLQQQSAATVDLSWLYDVPVERLRGHCVGVCGMHALDLAVWLTYSQVDFITAVDPRDLVRRMPAGELLCISDLLGAYYVESLADQSSAAPSLEVGRA